MASWMELSEVEKQAHRELYERLETGRKQRNTELAEQVRDIHRGAERVVKVTWGLLLVAMIALGSWRAVTARAIDKDFLETVFVAGVFSIAHAYFRCLLLQFAALEARLRAVQPVLDTLEYELAITNERTDRTEGILRRVANRIGSL